MTEATVLPVLHPDARELYNVCGDLKTVAHDLFDVGVCLTKEVRVSIKTLPRLTS